ncbi:SRPBCC family protein [Hyphobacterium marinum]|uniref:SRPBCC family protein n=1 Tax=Hyphobacterium marinum TaxID=3116574 RepID=A0ABU7M0D3_9PROT|nr:SRPBCC family protein [Hyphobacterium sp. Y6023]MEE2567002.1 SRPBCC family protein [Hyphobacterium sp. Y6023]
MDLKFSVSGRISRPVDEVFEAVADPAKLSGYFTTGGAKGRLETGATVMWEFHDYPGAFPVKIIEVEPNRKIILEWQANDTDPVDPSDGPSPYDTTVTLTFEPIDEGRRTLVTIAEEGWRPTEAGRKSSYGNCMGWSQMLCAMKAWVEHGLNIREGMYK